MAKKKHQCPEPENTERWAVSYLDMITVMMCLFLVLYAISQVDNGKLNKLRRSLAAGFNNTAVSEAKVITKGGLGVLMGSTSAASVGQLLGSDGVADNKATPERAAAMREASHLNEIKEKVEKDLTTAGHGKTMEYRITERGLVLGLVANDTYFKPGQAAVEPQAQEILSIVAPTLASLQEQIAVEGFADPNPNYSVRFPDNDFLAAGRAIEVMHHLQGHGVPGDRLRITSYGANHQQEVEGDLDLYSVNRRADIVIISMAKDSVRSLLPEASRALEKGLPSKPLKSQSATVK